VVAIVLLPGMDGSGTLFADFISALKMRSKVVSYPTDQPLGYDELKEFVRSFLPSDEQFILLGESFSGPIAISLASERLPQLRAVVLICSFARLPDLPLSWLLKRLGSALPFWRAPSPLVARVLLGRFRSAPIEAVLKRAIHAVPPQVWKVRLSAVLAVDEKSSLCRIQVPVLYLRASKDRVVFPSASEVISEYAPGTKVVEIEGPHFLLQAKPQESAVAVRAFANEHGLAL
jgi:pimeloyl-[acyl-carrier protein] methyl ester esterase